MKTPQPTFIDEALEKERKRLVKAFRTLLPVNLTTSWPSWRKQTLKEVDKFLWKQNIKRINKK